MRRAVFLPCCLTWGQIMMEVMKIMVTLLEKVPCRYCHTQCSQPCSRTPLTHTSAWDSWTLTGKSGSVSCGVTSPFSWVLVHTRFCLCPPRVCFPSPVEVVLSSSTGPQIFSGFSVSLLDPQVGKSFVGLGTFATVWELLWYNCSPVCGLSASRLYGGTHIPCLQGLLQPESLSLQ